MRTLSKPAWAAGLARRTKAASGQAVMRLAGLLALVLLASGCSYLFVEGPPPASAPPATTTDCTTNKAWPHTDLTLAIFGGVMAGLIYADADRWHSRNEAHYEAVSTLSGALVYLWSAWDGHRKVDACRAFTEERLEQGGEGVGDRIPRTVTRGEIDQ